MPEEKIAEMLQGTVAILGGGAVGLETAAFLAQRLPEGAAEFGIKIIEQKEKMGMDMGAMARPLLNELKKKNVSFLTTTTATLMDGSKLYVKIGEMTLFVSADTVIWAGGGEPVVDTELTLWLMDERMSYAAVGDANEIGDGGTAIKAVSYTHLSSKDTTGTCADNNDIIIHSFSSIISHYLLFSLIYSRIVVQSSQFHTSVTTS